MEKNRQAWRLSCNQLVNNAMDSGALDGTEDKVGLGVIAHAFFAMLVVFDLVGDQTYVECLRLAKDSIENWRSLQKR